MQNMDFHTRKPAKNYPPQFDTQDPEYFYRISDAHHHEQEKNRKSASRMISLIIALCILSFTSGLVIGIKVSSDSKKDLVDAQTRRAMSTIGKKVSRLVGERALAEPVAQRKTARELFPSEDFPFAVRVGNEFNAAQSREIARLLSGSGYTVILSKNMENYRIYAGPFKTRSEAEISLKKIQGYPNKAWFGNAHIVKR